MSTLINFGEGNTSGVMAPLIPFNCVFDTDFGVINLIYREYFDKSVFSVDFFNKNHKIKDIVLSLFDREEENPLSICILPEMKDSMDNLYAEFLEKKYEDILKLSMPTEVYNTIELFKLAGDIKPTIICESEIEEKFLDYYSVTKGVQKMRIEEIKELTFFEQFYFKSINDFYCNILSDSIKTKMVYIADYKFNIDEKRNLIDNKNTLLLDLNRNKFMLFDIYNRYKLKGEQ